MFQIDDQLEINNNILENIEVDKRINTIIFGKKERGKNRKNDVSTLPPTTMKLYC